MRVAVDNGRGIELNGLIANLNDVRALCFFGSEMRPAAKERRTSEQCDERAFFFFEIGMCALALYAFSPVGYTRGRTPSAASRTIC